MTTSKKDYIAFAATIKNAWIDTAKIEGETSQPSLAVRYALRLVAADMAAYYAADNPRFNVKTFFEACGLEVL